MAYKILKSDGTTLITLADSVVDQSATSLALVGKNYSGYGEFLNNNLVRMLSNSASSTSRPPRSPLTGQLWYDTGVKRLKVYDGGFRTINGVPFSSSVPTAILTGDFWYDSTNEQLKLYNGLESVVIGPDYPASAGENGWVIPSDSLTVNDADTDSAQDVLILKSYNQSVAIVNGGPAFETTTGTATEYLPTAYPNPEVVTGLTISNDLRVYGQMSNHGMTAAFNIDNIVPLGNNDVTDPVQIDIQNNLISPFLDKMFPTNAKTTGTYRYPGMPIGSLARVAIWKTDGTSSQVRLFRTVGTVGASFWQAWNLPEFTLKNIID
jgi:hypothetical protein